MSIVLIRADLESMGHGSNGSLFSVGSMGHGSEPLTHWPITFFIDYLLNFIINQNNQVALNNYAYVGLEWPYFNSLYEVDYILLPAV